jgi:Protein of unknown function (DUF4238)
MAGIRHHILPRFLLKGFASKIDKKKVFTWIYEKDKGADERSTKDIGIEKHFYGDKNGLNIDDIITQLEPELARYLSDAIKLPEGVLAEENKDVVKLAVHMFIRTRYLREILSTAVQSSFHSMKSNCLEDSNYKEFILNMMSTERINEELVKSGHHVDENWKPFFIDIIKQALPLWIDSNYGKLQSDADTLLLNMSSEMKPKLATSIRESHVEVLSENLIPEGLLDSFLLLNWFILDSPIPLVIGDIVCLFRDHRNTNKYFNIMECDLNKHDILFPLSASKLLIGSHSKNKPKVIFRKFREEYIKWSNGYFVCSHYSDEIAKLSSKTGENLKNYIEDKADKVIKEAVERAIK